MAIRANAAVAAQTCVVLDRFDFDRDALKPQHAAQLRQIAAYIIRKRQAGRPVRALRLIGHTDPAGPAAYNMELGRRRAQRTAMALRQMLESIQPGSSRGVALIVESRGEQQPIANDPARSRRVQICLPRSRRRRQLPPDRPRCGVPQRGTLGEIALEAELAAEAEVALEAEQEAEFGSALEMWEQERTGTRPTPPRRRVAVRPRLCLFLNASVSAERNHFECGASRQARRIAAIASPNAAACSKRVGATPYSTGADILQAIQDAHACLNQRLDTVHIFNHSGSHGLYGREMLEHWGLYMDQVSQSDRAAGARVVTEIPTAALSNNVVFVLHGCNTAAGEDSFAQALYNHLAASLSNPVVYGHHNSGCASRDNSWRVFSKRNPAGRNVASAAPHYTDVGCCG